MNPKKESLQLNIKILDLHQKKTKHIEFEVTAGMNLTDLKQYIETQENIAVSTQHFFIEATEQCDHSTPIINLPMITRQHADIIKVLLNIPNTTLNDSISHESAGTIEPTAPSITTTATTSETSETPENSAMKLAALFQNNDASAIAPSSAPKHDVTQSSPNAQSFDPAILETEGFAIYNPSQRPTIASKKPEEPIPQPKKLTEYAAYTEESVFLELQIDGMEGTTIACKKNPHTTLLQLKQQVHEQTGLNVEDLLILPFANDPLEIQSVDTLFKLNEIPHIRLKPNKRQEYIEIPEETKTSDGAETLNGIVTISDYSPPPSPH